MYLIIILSLLFGYQPQTTHSDSSSTIAYVNGQIWNGENFIERPLFIRDGKFIEEPSHIDSTVNLSGKYILPPFGDAHTHNLGVGGISKQIAKNKYIKNGVFYAADLTNPYSEITQIRGWFKRDATLDVAFANGGITSTGSHPTGAMERIFTDKEKITLGNLELENDAYWFFDTKDDIENKWSKFLAQKPDVVKVYLTYVSKGLKKDECYGLCPDVLKAIVDSAHSNGTEVFAHVNTASDVNFALDAKVDVLAHLPSGNDGIGVEQQEFWLDDKTIAKAGKQNITVIPTASKLIEGADPDTLKEEIARQQKQLRDLHKAGAQIALGADEWRKTVLFEAIYIQKYEIFNNIELLNILSTTTPKTIFPDRKIGHLSKGYEGSFIALNCNPVEKFECVKAISQGVKEGNMVIK
ncbi:amidohydrolase family protein [Fodinibius saliphilus]|uniref:amidohydrolase family protein n=1 Tax=Fodinibius saliphilus TaxID=1920650 RepID=UPI001109FCC3|nr:amidohydrolase family protein [Fodinibius saliphilus]